MSVIGTPVSVSPSTGTSTCSDQAAVTPVVSSVFGCAVKGRLKAVDTFQGLTPTIKWTMVDSNGNPVDLSTCGSFDGVDESAVTLRIHESVFFPPNSSPLYQIDGTVTDTGGGGIQFVLTSDVTKLPGVYLCEATVTNTDGDPIFSNQFYLVVKRGLLGSTNFSSYGPPGIAEIRLHMRDSDPSENSLLDTVQFDVAEIALALELPVLYWNESNPPIFQNHNTQTFPYRFWWLEAVVSRLYIMAAHWYRRNQLPYSAGGVQVDDMNKADEYEKVGQQKWAEFKDFVLKKKVGLNCESAVTSTGSVYGSLWGEW